MCLALAPTRAAGTLDGRFPVSPALAAPTTAGRSSGISRSSGEELLRRDAPSYCLNSCYCGINQCLLHGSSGSCGISCNALVVRRGVVPVDHRALVQITRADHHHELFIDAETLLFVVVGDAVDDTMGHHAKAALDVFTPLRLLPHKAGDAEELSLGKVDDIDLTEKNSRVRSGWRGIGRLHPRVGTSKF